MRKKKRTDPGDISSRVEKPSSPGDGEEIIRPIRVHPNRKIAVRSASGPRYLIRITLLCISLAVIITGGLFLVSYLSKNPLPIDAPQEENRLSSPRTEDKRLPDSVRGNSNETKIIINPEHLELEKKEAEKQLAAFIQAKGILDSNGFEYWGGGSYDNVIRLAKEADGFFLEQKYAAAAGKYTQALDQMEILFGKREEALRNTLEEGERALVEGNGEQALNAFRLALMIDPKNSGAQEGMERAKTVEKVKALIESGKRHEKENNASFAYADYQAAFRLDPQSADARRRLNLIKEKIRSEQFQELMSSGLTAYQRGDFESARESLLKARSFESDSREVKDALAKIDQAIRLKKIEALNRKALLAEKTEDWAQALFYYSDVLKIDAAIQFAVRGKERCLEQMRAAKLIRFYLDKPHLLESERHLENALRLSGDASSIEPKGPLLSTLIEKLDRTIISAQTPVKIILLSDNQTDVAVFRVGKLGRFSSLELKLRPGTYTVMGSRRGYKDVQQKMIVEAGKSSLSLMVICRDKIT